MPVSRSLRLDQVKQAACCPLQCSQASGIEVVRLEPAFLFVICVVTTAIIEFKPHTRSAHPEGHELEQRWHRISRLHQSFVEPPTLPRKGPIYLLFFLLRHRLKSCEAATFHGVEAKTVADKIKVPHYLVAAVDALGKERSAAGLSMLPHIGDNAIFHTCHISVISGQFCLQNTFLLHCSERYPDDEDQPRE